MLSNNADILALTEETWLGTSVDKPVISEITPNRYRIHQIARNGKTGGELLECDVVVKSYHFRLCLIYRPPPSRTNKLKDTTFFKEWSDFLDRLVVIPDELLITGELNCHLDNVNLSDIRKFDETLSDHGLVQHVQGATHNKGHTLDVVITRDNSTIMQTMPSVRDPCLFDRNGNPSGDHFALFTSFEISKPPKQRNTVSYRKFNEINTTDLIQDLNTSKIVQNREGLIVNVVNLYNSELSSIIDKHAPLKLKNIILRPSTEWYSDELRAAKRDRRKAERRMRKSNLTVHREMFRDTCLKANKKDYFSNKIYKIEHDQKQLHRLTNDLMGNKRDVILPSHHDEKALADKFCEFFVGKISTILDNLAATNN
jgi:hypothetical protein